MTITGTWDSRLKTPLGSLSVLFTFTDVEGELRGTATGRGETVALRDLVAIPQPAGSTHLTWSQSITKPMRLDLDFEVTIAGDELTGSSRAGRLPKTSVVGARV
ncbi:MAG: hypothetical protein RI885_1252 [Actinomycetota bacterium]|jgi:hypothetical protein